jgi:hypothetical protein
MESVVIFQESIVLSPTERRAQAEARSGLQQGSCGGSSIPVPESRSRALGLGGSRLGAPAPAGCDRPTASARAQQCLLLPLPSSLGDTESGSCFSTPQTWSPAPNGRSAPEPPSFCPCVVLRKRCVVFQLLSVSPVLGWWWCSLGVCWIVWVKKVCPDWSLDCVVSRLQSELRKQMPLASLYYY